MTDWQPDDEGFDPGANPEDAGYGFEPELLDQGPLGRVEGHPS